MTTKIKSGVIGDNVVGITQLNVSDGTNGQVLTTDGSGTLSFSTVSGTTINNNADNRIITGSGTANTLEGEANLTFDGSTLDVTGTTTISTDLNVGGAVKGNAGTRAVSIGTVGSVTGGLQLWSPTNGTSYVQFGDEAGTSANHYRGYMAYNHTNDSMSLGTSSSTKVTIDSAGNVGIGITNIGSAGLSILNSMNFNISEGANSSFVNIFRQASSAATVIANGYKYSANANQVASSYGSLWAKSLISLNYGNIVFYTDSATTTAVGTDVTPTERMRITSAGQLLVGTSSNASGTRVHIDGGSSNLGQLGLRNSSATSGNFWRMGQNSDSHYIHYNQSGTGVYILNGGTSWSGNSDETIKENIVELTGVLDKVRNFRCVEYNLISDETNSKKIGFIAQDWQEDYSQVISQDENGKLGMAYTETIPVLLKAIQEQQALIEAQATTIADLTARIETLEG